VQSRTATCPLHSAADDPNTRPATPRPHRRRTPERGRHRAQYSAATRTLAALIASHLRPACDGSHLLAGKLTLPPYGRVDARPEPRSTRGFGGSDGSSLATSLPDLRPSRPRPPPPPFLARPRFSAVSDSVAFHVKRRSERVSMIHGSNALPCSCGHPDARRGSEASSPARLVSLPLAMCARVTGRETMPTRKHVRRRAASISTRESDSPQEQTRARGGDSGAVHPRDAWPALRSEVAFPRARTRARTDPRYRWRCRTLHVKQTRRGRGHLGQPTLMFHVKRTPGRRGASPNSPHASGTPGRRPTFVSGRWP
jgi:hypothetical protein